MSNHRYPYHHTATYSDVEIEDVRSFVDGLGSKIYIIETKLHYGGNQVEYHAISEQYLNYVLWEVDNLSKKRQLLKENPSLEFAPSETAESLDGGVCTISEVGINSYGNGLGW